MKEFLYLLLKKHINVFLQSLIDDMKSILSGDFEEAVLALMMSVAEYDAHCLHDAIDGAGTNESVLIGILTTRNSKVRILSTIKKTFHKLHDVL